MHGNNNEDGGRQSQATMCKRHKNVKSTCASLLTTINRKQKSNTDSCRLARRTRMDIFELKGSPTPFLGGERVRGVEMTSLILVMVWFGLLELSWHRRAMLAAADTGRNINDSSIPDSYLKPRLKTVKQHQTDGILQISMEDMQADRQTDSVLLSHRVETR